MSCGQKYFEILIKMKTKKYHLLRLLASVQIFLLPILLELFGGQLATSLPLLLSRDQPDPMPLHKLYFQQCLVATFFYHIQSMH